MVCMPQDMPLKSAFSQCETLSHTRNWVDPACPKTSWCTIIYPIRLPEGSCVRSMIPPALPVNEAENCGCLWPPSQWMIGLFSIKIQNGNILGYSLQFIDYRHLDPMICDHVLIK